MVQTMPMGNSMPIFSPENTGGKIGTAAAPRTAAAVVDAHTVPNMEMDSVIQQVTSAMPMVLTEKEMAIRKQIATKVLSSSVCFSLVRILRAHDTSSSSSLVQVLITMGSKILHFEDNIKPDGTVTVDWTFQPMKGWEDNLSDETCIKSHAVLRIYSEHTMVPPEKAAAAAPPTTGQSAAAAEDFLPETPTLRMANNSSKATLKQIYDTPDSKFCYLTGCTAIDLAALMQHNLDVTTGKVDHVTQREFDFAAQTNFCNTFNVCTLLPLDDMQDPDKEILEMRQDLDRFREGLAAYDREAALAKKEGRGDISTSSTWCMSSILGHLPDIESIVRVQQGLQQAYCAKAVKEGKLCLMECNAMGFTGMATYRQLHGAPICFSDTSKMVRDRIAPIPKQQLYVQMYSAICNLGMSLEEFATMKDPAKVFEFMKATFAASIQVPYHDVHTCS